jgi:anti-anti-sigma regulatory factor
MVVYTVMRGRDQNPGRMTLHVEGEVSSDNWEKLREFCLDALRSSDDLVLDLEKVGVYDFSLGILVCLLRRTVLLLGKRLTVRGRQQEFFCQYEATLGSEAKRCSFTRASTCCTCENLFTRTTIS